MPTPTGVSCAVTMVRDRSPHAVGSLAEHSRRRAGFAANSGPSFHLTLLSLLYRNSDRNAVTPIKCSCDRRPGWDARHALCQVFSCAVGLRKG